MKQLFGAHGQLAFGALLVAVTLFQAWYWGIHTKPSTDAIFWLSIEALFFAAYSIVATALGYRATERVETAVVENIENVSGDVEIK